MKINEVPQEKSFFSHISKELCYAKNNEEKYETALSTGWNIKHEALVEAWDDIKLRIEKARIDVKNGNKSPVYFFMELNLMDTALLSAYTGFWKFTIKRHLNPDKFKKLSEKKLGIYAKVFGVSINELKQFNPNNENRP